MRAQQFANLILGTFGSAIGYILLAHFELAVWWVITIVLAFEIIIPILILLTFLRKKPSSNPLNSAMPLISASGNNAQKDQRHTNLFVTPSN